MSNFCIDLLQLQISSHHLFSQRLAKLAVFATSFKSNLCGTLFALCVRRNESFKDFVIPQHSRGAKMKQRFAAAVATILVLTFFSAAVFAASNNDPKIDSDTRIIDAKVVEVTDAHISVMARTGVEHVIAIDRVDTKAVMDGQSISLKDVREGDVITIDLDAKNPIKFAKNISVQPNRDQVATLVP